jgi:hypothetical protein
MPIRFRCAYCNQLMGIARRKAGTVVSCPNCAGQVVVPAEEEPEETAGASPSPPPIGPTAKTETEAPIFERNDFNDLFRPSPKAGAPMPQNPLPAPAQPATSPLKPPAPVPMAPAPAPPRMDFPSNLPAPATSPPVPAGGYLVSRSMATLLIVAGIVALALAFTAGLLVGRFYLQPGPEETQVPSFYQESLIA